MITLAEAEEIAAGWARGESERRGYECTPMVSEFDLGFVVWTKQPSSVLPIPGDGVRTVIDRETGAVSTFPGVPVAVVADLYRQQQPEVAARRRTVAPEVELRRNARRRPSPTTAAHLTVDGRLFIARGAKGDQRIDHHPLVAAHLRAMEPGSRVRGTERHAELIVLSDVLYEADRLRAVPLTLDEARAWLRTAEFEAVLVREPGDPLAGAPARPCESCLVTLVDFALVPWPQLAFVEPLRPYSENVAQPGRFPDQVAGALADAGWRPMHRMVAEALADGIIEDVVAVPGRRFPHRSFPAARNAIMDFPGIFCGLRVPGAQRQVRWLSLEPAAAAHTADVLGELAEVIGAALFPLGVEAKGDAIVAIDERGRLFALDQGGEWFLGETLDEGLVSLLTGDGPAERIRDDGTW
ncbi:SUKH-3 domain-containing protein [Pseudosporangium ferrugineum]|uniref:YwqJ-like deaminase n=1 Tax=Pseudosporangium ferrugineum TaxID=439699 RepID=A0A2T0S1E5_9ACTN|nr:SUKH-3 domain-containing protein [Pseudosporangium ferrugineum]PRY27231.1 YwqJ-like deaminase [Pseudosporangium ferrugineum]